MTHYSIEDDGHLLEQIISDDKENARQKKSFSTDDDTLLARPVIGLCTNDAHPTLQGRIQVQWLNNEAFYQQWLPILHGLTFRKNDRVLIQYPVGSTEPIVIGVIDGYAMRPEPKRDQGPQLTLKNDESLKILSAAGETLFEVYPSEHGPVLKLNDINTRFELPGKLCIDAKEIEFIARQGGVRVSASDDVVIEGEEIKLN